jgi:hypothetical protein
MNIRSQSSMLLLHMPSPPSSLLHTRTFISAHVMAINLISNPIEPYSLLCSTGKSLESSVDGMEPHRTLLTLEILFCGIGPITVGCVQKHLASSSVQSSALFDRFFFAIRKQWYWANQRTSTPSVAVHLVLVLAWHVTLFRRRH